MSSMGRVMFPAPHSAPARAKSSLEEMLESIRRRDEGPTDAPPPLPSRPVSRARLPPSRRPLPFLSKAGGGGGGTALPDQLPNGFAHVETMRPPEETRVVARDRDSCFKSGAVFGSKKFVKVDVLVDSPYSRSFDKEEEENHVVVVVDDRSNDSKASVVSQHNHVSVPLSNGTSSTQPDNISYILRKVKKFQILFYLF